MMSGLWGQRVRQHAFAAGRPAPFIMHVSPGMQARDDRMCSTLCPFRFEHRSYFSLAVLPDFFYELTLILGLCCRVRSLANAKP